MGNVLATLSNRLATLGNECSTWGIKEFSTRVECYMQINRCLQVHLVENCAYQVRETKVVERESERTALDHESCQREALDCKEVVKAVGGFWDLAKAARSRTKPS